MNFKDIINAKYVVYAAPRQVETLHHELHDPKKNREAADWLQSRPSELIHEDAKGALRLYDTSVAYLSKDTTYPIPFFLTFSSLHKGILLEHIWKDASAKSLKITGMPLGVYSLFEILLPRFEVVVLGEENTPDGESKRRTEQALSKGFHVYLTNEHGVLFEATTWKEVIQREALIWGKDAKFLARTVVLSTKPLHKE